MEKKKGQEPAFASNAVSVSGGIVREIRQRGMSKRLVIAKDILCALISSDYYGLRMTEKELIKMLYSYTDKLIQLEDE